MYIHSKPAAAFYKLAIGIISLFLEWFIFSQYGWTALRFFSTWVLFLAAIYYLSSALHLATTRENVSGKNPCPMLEGMIIAAFCLISGTVIAAQSQGFSLPDLPTWLMIIVAGVLPVLTLLDWILFVKKGRFTVMMPFYWLALPACYAATIIFTAELLPESTLYRYPLEMFNYLTFGPLEMFLVMLIVAIIYLAVGYAWYLLDFTLSGKLAKKIVMLHVRTVEVPDIDISNQAENLAESANAVDSNEEMIDELNAPAADPISTAADEALEELKEFTEPKTPEPSDRSESTSASSEASQISSAKVDDKKVEVETIKTTKPKSPKTGKATDIEVIRERVNGNKSGKKSPNTSKAYNKSNNSRNFHKKRSKKRRR